MSDCTGIVYTWLYFSGIGPGASVTIIVRERADDPRDAENLVEVKFTAPDGVHIYASDVATIANRHRGQFIADDPDPRSIARLIEAGEVQRSFRPGYVIEAGQEAEAARAVELLTSRTNVVAWVDRQVKAVTVIAGREPRPYVDPGGVMGWRHEHCQCPRALEEEAAYEGKQYPGGKWSWKATPEDIPNDEGEDQ